MQIFHIDGLVIATHDDGVPVPAGAYPGAVRVVGDASRLSRAPDGVTLCINQAATAADVRAEYHRRLIVLLGATDLAHAAFIRADDADETTALLSIAGRSSEQDARLDELIVRRSAVARLIEAYNALDAAEPIPQDFAEDAWWA